MNYVDALVKYHNQNGKDIRLPFVDKKPLDLYRLKKAVENRGGFDKVCKSKKWAEIGRDLGYSGKIMSSLSTSLKNSYQKFLCPYEEYLRAARPGVHQQLELEYGGPLTPSPAPSPMKRSTVNTPASLRSDSPARHASGALQATIGKEQDGDSSATPGAPSAAQSGFTAINSGGGFTAVNSGFTSVNRLSAAESKPFTPSRPGSALASAKNTPEYRPSGLGPANALKRQLSCDSMDAKNDIAGEKEDTDASSRRSKRIKKGKFVSSPPCRLGCHTRFIDLRMRLAILEGSDKPLGSRVSNSHTYQCFAPQRPGRNFYLCLFLSGFFLSSPFIRARLCCSHCPCGQGGVSPSNPPVNGGLAADWVQACTYRGSRWGTQEFPLRCLPRSAQS